MEGDAEYSKTVKEFWPTIAKIKKLVKSELRPEDWHRFSFCKKQIEQHNYPQNIDYFESPPPNEFFEAHYKNPGRPALINGVIEHWPATKNWTFEELNNRFGNSRFKVGEDDDGKTVKIKLKHFIMYTFNNRDDAPITLFDSMFGEQKHIRTLMADYSVPTYFAENWHRFSEYSRQPPNRWFVIGPARSGTNIHVDPMGTSAWNALVIGTKLWVMFPPSTPKHLVKIPSDYTERELKGEAIGWFRSVYTQCRSPDWPEEYRPIFCRQRAGEVIFVPSGWWHVVLNAEDTVAITENFCDSSNFLRAISIAKRSRPRYHRHWLRALKAYRPDIADRFPDVFAKISATAYDSDGGSSSSSDSSSSEDEGETVAYQEVADASDSSSDHMTASIESSQGRERSHKRSLSNSCSTSPRSQRLKLD